MLKYAIYARKSHDDKKLTEKSTGEQVAECRALAERDGLTVLRVFEESKSAKTPGVRAQYADLIKQVERGKVDAILCWHVNRLARNMEEGGKLVQLLIEGKIREIRTPHATYRSGDNILPVVIDAASATQYSLDLGHTVSRSLEGNFRGGGCNHKAPPGYRNARDPLNSKRGLVEPDPNRFALIERAWRLLLSGEHNVMEIQRSLNRWGFRMRQTLNLPARPIGYAAVLAMFRNPFYAGYVQQRGEVLRGKHKPMVTIDEFREVQRILSSKSFQAKRTHWHPYTGLMRCAHCGQQVTAEVKKLRGGPWEVYHCSDSYNRCTQKGMSLAQVDEALLRALRSLQVDFEALLVARESIRRAAGLVKGSLETKQRMLKVALLKAEERRKRLVEMWLAGLLSDEAQYRALDRDIVTECDELLMASDSSQFSSERLQWNVDAAIRSLSESADLFSSVKPEGRKPLIQAIGDVEFYGPEKRLTIRLKPILERVAQFAMENWRSLEPTKSSSYRFKKAASSKPLYLGRRGSCGIEPPESLIMALATEEVPELPPRDIGDVVASLERRS